MISMGPSIQKASFTFYGFVRTLGLLGPAIAVLSLASEKKGQGVLGRLNPRPVNSHHKRLGSSLRLPVQPSRSRETSARHGLEEERAGADTVLAAPHGYSIRPTLPGQNILVWKTKPQRPRRSAR